MNGAKMRKVTITRSTNKPMRRIHTQVHEQIGGRNSQNSKRKSQRNNSRQKYLDVYSKIKKQHDSQQHKKGEKTEHCSQLTQRKTQPPRKITIQSSCSDKNKNIEEQYQVEGVVGKGTFGTVYWGYCRGNGKKVALKKVLQDKRYKNRQLSILKQLRHPNVLVMENFFMTYQDDKEYLNIVMEYFPSTLYQIVHKSGINLPLIKILLYQLVRAINYLASLCIVHRDIKPQNILVDMGRNKAVICDFGSAKQVVKGESNLSYICSRCYRAPQLIFGSTSYNSQIDMWSLGCVLVEMINGQPPFVGDSQIDQLIEIIKVLGTPTKEEIMCMNKNYSLKEYKKFPQIHKTSWKKLLKIQDSTLIDLVDRLLQYNPHVRLTPAEALIHPFFNDLRDERKYKQLLQQYRHIPELFNFTKEQLGTNDILAHVVPAWVESKQSYGFSVDSFHPTKKMVHKFI